MKCPQCGSDLEMDFHRKIPLMMCYNCGYIEGRTATVSTTVYMLYQNSKKDPAVLYWVLVNLLISTVVLLTVNLLEARQKKAVKA